MPKIERSTSLASTPKAQSVSRPAAAASPAAQSVPSAPSTAWAPRGHAPKEQLVPKGANVSRSASVDALWGEASETGETARPVNLDQAAFRALPPAEQLKVIEAAKAEQQQLGTEIEQRVEVLDRRWNNSRLSTRTEALREYHDRGGHRLGRRQREKLDGLVHRSEEAQRKINVLRAKIDALPKTPEAKQQQAELRNELARELRRARDEQSKVVKEATEVIDAEGLKVDRLAVTEQVIDPSAPAEGSGQSLLEKIARFFHLDVFFTFVREWSDSLDTYVEQQVERRSSELADERDRKFFDQIRKLTQREADERLRDQLARSSAPASEA